MTKFRSKLTALLCIFAMLVALIVPAAAIWAEASGNPTNDSDVENSASFSTDTI